MFKSEFKFEPYIDLIKINSKYRIVVFKYLVRTCWKSNEVVALDQSPQLKIDDVTSAMLPKMLYTLYWNAPLI